ncbi:MAG: hypothetical protein R2874_09435 [Desulfobacterales bacterium]
MIADDLVRFVKNDLQGFGSGFLCFLVVTLGVLFRTAVDCDSHA